MTVNKGLKSLVEATPNFSNQALENAIYKIRDVDLDDGYQWIKSTFDMDTAIRNNTVLTTSQKNDAIETLNASYPHLQIGLYLNDIIRHTNTILDATIIPIPTDEVKTATFLEILQLVQTLQQIIPGQFGITPAEKNRDVNDHLGILNNMFTETEDSSDPVFTRLKELMQSIDTTARVNSTLATGTAAVRYSNTQLVTFLGSITDDSTDFQTTLDNRVNQAAGNMASLQTRIQNAIPGDIIADLIAIRDEIVTQVNLENSNITTLRSYTESLSNNSGYVGMAEDPKLRKLMAKVAQDSNWKTYFNEYEQNQSYSNPMYTVNTDSDKSTVINQVLAQRGLPDVMDPIDLDGVAEKAMKDARIDTKNFDHYTVEQIITKCCEQLNLRTIGSVYNQSGRLLSNLNEQDRKIVADELDLNESSNTLS